MKEKLYRLEEKALNTLFGVCFLAFTNPQRKALHIRDKEFGGPVPPTNKGDCQYPLPHECNGHKKTHEHHIKPQGYMIRMGLMEFMDRPENGLTICQNAHTGKDGVHPDNPTYLNDYREGDKEAFKRMQDDRKKRLDCHEIYWDDKADRAMEIQAIRNTARARQHGWVFPDKGEK